MEHRSMFVGLDVHKETIDVSIAEGQRDADGPPGTARGSIDRLLGQPGAQRLVLSIAVVYAGARWQCGGNILDFVALMEGCSVRDAALRLQDWSGAMPPRRTLPAEQTAHPASNAPLRFTSQHIDRHHPYLAGRGLAAETIRAFGVGFYGGRGFLRGRVVIPIHDEHGTLVEYAGRAIDGQEPKYRFPRGFRKSLVSAGSDSSMPSERPHERDLRSWTHSGTWPERSPSSSAGHYTYWKTITGARGSRLRLQV